MLPRSTPGPSAALPFAGVTVLVVDDDELLLDGMRAMLESLGVRVLLAPDGRAGLRLLATSAPDLVLCDLQMPRLDGFGFMARVRETPGLERMPVVAISGLGSAADRRRTQDAGFRAHLVKPIGEKDLFALLDALL